MDIVSAFVVGAPKAGTTSLFSILAASPEVCMPIVKEPNYFCPDVRRRWESQKNMDVVRRDWTESENPCKPGAYHTGLIESLADYGAIYQCSGGRGMRLDFSTNYLASEKAPMLVARYNDRAKVLMLLRDPVERALSHYQQDVSMGRHAFPFRWCLQQEQRALAAGKDSVFSYIRDGSYGKAYLRWARHFPREQILTVSFKHFADNQCAVVARICDFLGIEAVRLDGLVAKNRAREVRFKLLAPLFRNEALRQKLRRSLPGPVKELVKSCVFRDAPRLAALQEQAHGFFAAEDFELVRSTDV